MKRVYAIYSFAKAALKSTDKEYIRIFENKIKQFRVS